MIFTTTTYQRAADITAATPIQQSGVAGVTLMHAVAMELERLQYGLANSLERVDTYSDDQPEVDENDIAMWAANVRRTKTLGCLIQSYFSGERTTLGEVASEIAPYNTARGLERLLRETRHHYQEEEAAQRARTAEVTEARAARSRKAAQMPV